MDYFKEFIEKRIKENPEILKKGYIQKNIKAILESYIVYLGDINQLGVTKENGLKYLLEAQNYYIREIAKIIKDYNY